MTLLSYTIVANVEGSIETHLQEFKIQEEVNTNDLGLIVNSSQVKFPKLQNMNICINDYIYFKSVYS